MENISCDPGDRYDHSGMVMKLKPKQSHIQLGWGVPRL